MSRVALSSLRSLTFYRGSLTKARRVDPIKQLNCHGTACGLYQPEVVRCYNEGGEGIDIDWRCEADLPEKLRFGKVEVSCEGWDRPGDPYILKGSCGLDYRLVSINDSPNFESSAPWPYLSFVLFLLIVCVFFALHYGLFKNCRRPRPNIPRPNFNSYYPYGHGNNSPPSPPPGPPPPPYSSTPKEPQAPSNSSNSTFTPGFWTGVGVGGLGAAAAQRMFQNRDNQARPLVPVPHEDHSRPYDWESRHNERPSSRTPMWGPGSNNNNRGGSSGGSSSSGLGSMRRATGYGSTNVR